MKKLCAFVLLILATSMLPAQVPLPGLAGSWEFTGNANDNSGNSNNGTIRDVTGKQIYVKEITGTASHTLDVSAFANGIYMVELSNAGNEKVYRKLIISK